MIASARRDVLGSFREEGAMLAVLGSSTVSGLGAISVEARDEGTRARVGDHRTGRCLH